eukprot:6551811-Pyramimonas_sp.AAC.1
MSDGCGDSQGEEDSDAWGAEFAALCGDNGADGLSDGLGGATALDQSALMLVASGMPPPEPSRGGPPPRSAKRRLSASALDTLESIELPAEAPAPATMSRQQAAATARAAK